MKMKLFLACGILLSLFLSSANTQTLKQTIRGTIQDADSKMPLIGVTLLIDGSDPIIGTVTDPDGNFIFSELPIGRYNVIVNYLGYETQVIPNVLIGSGKQAVLNVALTESVTSLDAVVVKANQNKGEALNDMAAVSARSFTVEETQRFAGSFNDPSRMVTSYAGVVGDSDGDNSIIIRGNSPCGLLWRVEGVDVPNPNHFSEEGSTGGPISILNSTTLANSDFLTGAFPADYGDAYSGVFDIKLRKGNNEKREYTVQAGVIGVELAAEGPFSSKSNGSYLVNYRYSSIDILNKIGVDVAGDAVPKFQDITFNVDLPTNKFGHFQVFGIGGNSKIKYDEPTWSNVFSQYMSVVGVNHILPVSKKIYLKTSFAVSGSFSDWDYKERNDETSEMELHGSDRLDYVNFRGAMDISYKLSAKNSFKAGASIYSKQYDLLADLYNYDDDELNNVLDESGGSELAQAYLAWKFRPIQTLTFNAGLHYTYLNLNGNLALEPRLGLRWQFAPQHAFSAGFGKHSKMENISFYMAKVKQEDGTFNQPNRNLDFIRANHYVFGYEYRISTNMNLKVEAYYQDLYDVPVEDDSSSVNSALNMSDGYIFEPFSNSGYGKNYGAEITLEKFFSRNYYFLFTSSLYNSKFKPLDGIERNSRFNGRFVFNLVGGKEIPMGKNKNNALAFNVRATYAGGQYYSPIDPVQSADKEYTVRPIETAFSKTRPDYFRADLKVSFRRNKTKSTRIWELDLQNVSNTLNITGDFWDNDDMEIVEYTQLGLLPILSYRIEF